MNKSNNHLVIMAGGVGSRFWPMSTLDHPKQFIDVLGCGRTLIQLTLDRFKGICSFENIWVVTSDKYVEEVKRQLPEVADDHILREPCRRNTAPCIAYVSWKIKSRYPKANMVVTPSDHIVMDVKEFQRVITLSLEFTNHSDAILTLGMTPTRPETGYGYIEADLSYPSNANKEIYRVDSFKEKPDLATAERYIQKNSFYWNAGIFVWNVNTIVKALQIFQPAISNVFEGLLPYYFTAKEQELINGQFPTCENISIDYAIMEKANEIFVFPANF
jgi:mannose-1-phosphate guanylyltransferase